MVHSIITLTTDFGSKDHFVASMKGVMLGINPAARIVDISHELDPYDIRSAAYLIGACYACFPEASIHVAVVDPGVGGERRPILIEAAGMFFIGPDNGVFSHVCRDHSPGRIIHLTRESYFFRPSGRRLGPTFHGRDLFAPVAGWLSTGVDPAKFGVECDQATVLDLEEPRKAKEGLRGRVDYIDRFGNLITNIREIHLESMGYPDQAGRLEVILGSHRFKIKRFYAEAAAGKGAALLNSCGQLEIYISRGNARRRLGGRVGDAVTVRRIRLRDERRVVRGE